MSTQAVGRPGLPSRAIMGIGGPMQATGSPVDLVIPAGLERIWWPLFSRVQLTATITLANYFTTLPTNKRDGNFVTANSLPSPELYEIYGVGLHLAQQITIADAALILDSTTLLFKINDRTYLHSLAAVHPGGGGIHGAVATTVTATTLETASNGLPSPQAVHAFDIPYIIQAQEHFVCEAHVEPAMGALAASRDSWWIFYGYRHRKPVGQ